MINRTNSLGSAGVPFSAIKCHIFVLICPDLVKYQRLTFLVPDVWAIKNDPEFLRKSLIISIFKMVPKGRFELPTKGL